MQIIEFSQELSRDDLRNIRWLTIHHSELEPAAKIMMFAELDGVLIAVDHRGAKVERGLWMRMVHLLVVDDAKGLGDTGITKVVESEDEVEGLLF